MGFSSSLLLRLIRPKCIIGSSSNHTISGKWSARSSASWSNLRGLSTTSEAVRNQDSSPWLMLSPEFKAGTMNYKFYNLADNKVQTPSLSDEIPNLRLTCRGSSHGWLALLRPHHDDFFLYNPISRRHIKLPSILNLPRLPDRDTRSTDVKKLILSCSPDEDEENCRAVMINGCQNALAFCCPGRSKEWTWMSDEKRGERDYNDCVYSSRRKLFFALNSNNIKSGLETWDLGDPSSPKLIKVDNLDMYEYYCFPSIKRFLKSLCWPIKYLVVVNEDLFLVIQYIMDCVSPDGSCFPLDDECRPYDCRHMTIGFDVWKHDSKKGKFKYVDSSSLGDWAIFVGSHNHSVAIQANEFPGVKPNSIYFTDGHFTGTLKGGDDDRLFGFNGHDIGIYNYRDKTVSPCYYPCDAPSLKDILPAPIWFFPN